MHNYEHIEKFINEVNKEASKAAQTIYNKYDHILEKMILSQLNPGDKLFTGMGSAHVENKKGENVAEKLSRVLTNLEYPPELRIGFNTKDLTK